MTADKKLFHFRLNENQISYIDDVKEEGYSNRSDALIFILNEHKELKNKLFDLNYIVNQFKNEMIILLQEEYKKNYETELKRIRLGTNNTDRNTQILIELMHGSMIVNNVNHIPSTNDYKAKFLKDTEQLVKDRIAHLKQKKDSKEKE